MEPMTIRELLVATGGKLAGDVQDLDRALHSVETDSRALREDSLFIPLIGERFDAHDFLDTALSGGAAGCLCMRLPKAMLPGKFYILVENTQTALGDLAKYYRRKFDIPYIAVTGSVGKTTTKEMLATVLGQKYKVLKTEGNFNNEIGLPLTLFRLDHTHELCVLEMGMNHFGEIDYLARLVEPDAAVITNIGAAHIENLGSYENVCKAKCEIFAHMKPGSLAVLNGDDGRLHALQGTLAQEIRFYGTDHRLPYRASELVSLGDRGLRCTIDTPTACLSVSIPSLGNHMAYAALAATVIGEHYGLTPQEISEGIRQFVPTKMRMNVLSFGDVTVLDDAYNANPQSMRAALEVLAQSDSAYKVAILGDMFELGTLGKTLHHGIGDYAGRLGIDCLVAVGELSRDIYQAAKNSSIPDVFYFETKEETKTMLPELLKPGASILVKASRGMEFEYLIKEIKRVCSGS